MQIQAGPDPHPVAPAMLEGARSVGIPMAQIPMKIRMGIKIPLKVGKSVGIYDVPTDTEH
jgi:hypothetical protein